MEAERSPHVYVCDKCGADYHHNEQGQAVKHALEGHAVCSGCNGDTTHCGCIDSDEDCDRRPNCLLNVFPAPSPASVDVGEAEKLAAELGDFAESEGVGMNAHIARDAAAMLRSLSTALETEQAKVKGLEVLRDATQQRLGKALRNYDAVSATVGEATSRATAAEALAREAVSVLEKLSRKTRDLLEGIAVWCSEPADLPTPTQIAMRDTEALLAAGGLVGTTIALAKLEEKGLA